MSKINYSIVVPVFKSVNTLNPLFEEIQETMQKLQHSFEVIFVEDNGSSESWEELLRLKFLYPGTISIVRLSRNFGQNGATLCGIDISKGEKVITIDDDMQTPPKEIEKLIVEQEKSKADVVYGLQPDQNSSWFRRTGGRIIKRIFNKNQGGSSVGSSFRLIDSHVAERLRFHSQDHLFINQVISWYTLNFNFVEVEHNFRNEGKSGYSLLKLVGISFRLIFYYTSLPLKAIVFLCAFIAVASFVSGFYYLTQTESLSFDLKIILFGFVSITTLLLISISVFGIYLNRIYSSRVKKPNYAIKNRY